MRLAHHSMTWGGWYKKQNQTFQMDSFLADLKAAGYTATELGGAEDTHGPAAALKKKLADEGVGLAAWALSVTANPWPPNTERYRIEMDYAAEMGMKTLMVCGGFLGGRRNTFDSDYELFASNLAAAQEYADKNGQTIAYHPHVGCIVETNEEVDRLLKYIPNLKLTIDTGHLAAVRSDPIALARKYPKKIIHVHLKDWDPEKNAFAELGEGKAGLDFPAFFAAMEEIGFPGWIVVERDNTPMPPVESAKISKRFLDSILKTA
ncbi:MAG: sugar phosphate isomerase/epimerase [Planctomycetota bacterium]|nr:sugar phosphate isomerase/epimerase [Planctomycetota bacterium]